MRVVGILPIASLLPTFLYLHNFGRLKNVFQRILELLKLDVDEEPAVLNVSHSSGPFQSHLEILLYGDRKLNKLRMKLCVADFCWVCSLRSGMGAFSQIPCSEMVKRRRRPAEIVWRSSCFDITCDIPQNFLSLSYPWVGEGAVSDRWAARLRLESKQSV